MCTIEELEPELLGAVNCMNVNLPSRKPGVRFSLLLILIVAIALGVLLRIVNLETREFWYDEVLSVLLSSGQGPAYKNPSEIPIPLSTYTNLLRIPTETHLSNTLETLKNLFKGILSDPHPPLSYLSLHLGMRLFGNHEWALRGVVALQSIGAIACTYGLGRVLLGHRGGLLLGALLATNPFYLFHSLNIRMYGPLILWVTLSGWAMLELIALSKPTPLLTSDETPPDATPKPLWVPLFWTLVLTASVTAGFLTFYLFAYWVMALALLVLYLDRPHWFPHALQLGGGVILFLPWVSWGTLQQFRNRSDVLNQISQEGGNPLVLHLQDVANTLGSQLIWGDWANTVPSVFVTLAGGVAIAGLIGCTLALWNKGDRQRLFIALILGIFPLLLALSTDILTGKFTVGFGEGRSLSLILPGCLLLIALWIERASGKWKTVAATSLLGLYLLISIGDYTLRDRRPFHQLADSILAEPNTPTLIALNSRAWGHVLRLAYYIPPSATVDLLARDPGDLALDLEQAIARETSPYTRIVWLNAARSVWSPPATLEQNQQVENIVAKQFCTGENPCLPTETQALSGTMELDAFTVRIYQRSE
jgi:uncharacterized membrane protein